MSSSIDHGAELDRVDELPKQREEAYEAGVATAFIREALYQIDKRQYHNALSQLSAANSVLLRALSITMKARNG